MKVIYIRTHYIGFCLFYLLVLLASPHSKAQSNIDSLELEYKKNLSPKLKAAVSVQLGRLRNAYGLEGAEKLLHDGLSLSKQLKDSAQIAKAYETLGILKEKEGLMEIAMQYADSAAYVVERRKDTFRNFTLQLLYGELFRRKAKYAEALQHYSEAAHMAELLNSDDLRSKAYNALGIFYVNTKNYEDALKFHTKALALNEKLNNTMTIMNSLGNLGIVYRELKQFDKALALHKRALDMVLKTKDSSEISYQLNEIGVDYRGLGKYPEAVSNIKQSIAIREAMNENSELAYSYGNLGACFISTQQLDSAELYFKKALSHSKNIQNKRQISDNYLSLANLFEKTKHFDSSYKYSKLYNLMRDSLLEEDNQNIIQDLTIKYHIKEQELLLKDKDLTIKKRNNLIYTIMAITAAIAFSLVSRLRRKKVEYQSSLKDIELAAQEKASAGIIEAEENERQKLAADIHDGVGQFLNVAKIKLDVAKAQLDQNQTENKDLLDSASNLVFDSIQELRNISHNLTPPALLKFGLIEALQNLTNKLKQNKTAIHFFHEGWKMPLAKNVEIVLYRIIQECIHNCLKHADADEINISAINENGLIDISIEDNGKGFDPEQIKHGLGMMNIQKRVDYLKGQLSIESAPGKGTSLMIHLQA